MRTNKTLWITCAALFGFVALFALLPSKTVPASGTQPMVASIMAPADSSMTLRLRELRRRDALPVNALDEIKRRFQDPQTKQPELIKLVDSISEGDLPEMAQFVYDILKMKKTSDDSYPLARIILRWNKLDPDAVKAWVPEHIRYEYAWRAAGNIAAEWSMMDRNEAFQLAAKFRSPGLRQGAVAGILGRWSQKDPNAAVQYAMSQPEGTNRVNLLGTIGLVWGKNNYSAASAFVKSLPEGAERAHVQHCIDYGH
jgi:hypothetical protein